MVGDIRTKVLTDSEDGHPSCVIPLVAMNMASIDEPRPFVSPMVLQTASIGKTAIFRSGMGRKGVVGWIQWHNMRIASTLGKRGKAGHTRSK